MNRCQNSTPEPGAPDELQRATVCLMADSIAEKADFTTWMQRWRKHVSFVSHDYGCGCCVHLFDLEASKEAIDAIPPDLLTVSAWTEHGLKQVPRHLLS